MRRTKLYAVAIVQAGNPLEKLAKIMYGSSDPLNVQRVLDSNQKILNPKKIILDQDLVFPRIEEAKNLTYDFPLTHSRNNFIGNKLMALKACIFLGITI